MNILIYFRIHGWGKIESAVVYGQFRRVASINGGTTANRSGFVLQNLEKKVLQLWKVRLAEGI